MVQKFCKTLAVTALFLVHGCGGATPSPYIGSWQVVSIQTKRGPIKPTTNAVWTFKKDNTSFISGQQGTWKEENGVLSITTPKITYSFTTKLNNNQLVLTPKADFAGGQIGPITLQKIGE